MFDVVKEICVCFFPGLLAKRDVTNCSLMFNTKTPHPLSWKAVHKAPKQPNTYVGVWVQGSLVASPQDITAQVACSGLVAPFASQGWGDPTSRAAGERRAWLSLEAGRPRKRFLRVPMISLSYPKGPCTQTV